MRRKPKKYLLPHLAFYTPPSAHPPPPAAPPPRDFILVLLQLLLLRLVSFSPTTLHTCAIASFLAACNSFPLCRLLHPSFFFLERPDLFLKVLSSFFLSLVFSHSITNTDTFAFYSCWFNPSDNHRVQDIEQRKLTACTFYHVFRILLMYEHVNLCVRTYIFIQIRSCMCIYTGCVCAFVYMHIHVHTYTYICLHVCVCEHIYVYIYIYRMDSIAYPTRIFKYNFVQINSN